MEFYHLSKKDLGPFFMATPRIPESAALTEGNIPRICVSPNIGGCLRSINGGSGTLTVNDLISILKSCTVSDIAELATLVPEERKFNKTLLNPITIYSCSEQAFLPPDAVDFRDNQEHWYLNDTKFIRIGYLDTNNLIESKEFSVLSSPVKIDTSLIKADFDKILLNKGKGGIKKVQLRLIK